jgi:hypothetical protein
MILAIVWYRYEEISLFKTLRVRSFQVLLIIDDKTWNELQTVKIEFCSQWRSKWDLTAVVHKSHRNASWVTLTVSGVTGNTVCFAVNHRIMFKTEFMYQSAVK